MPHNVYLVVSTVADNDTDSGDQAVRDKVAETLGPEFTVFLGDEGEAA